MGGRHDLQRTPKVGQETNAANYIKGVVDIRVNLEVGGQDYIPEAETPGGPTRAKDGNEEVPVRTSVGQDMEGKYDRDGDWGADRGRED